MIDEEAYSVFKKHPEMRFIKLGKWNNKTRAKAPIEKDWKTVNNYELTSEHLRNHLLEGNNYGVVTGYGDIVVVDSDNSTIKEYCERLLPQTFTVKTGREGEGGYHLYYKCSLEKSIRLTCSGDNDGKTMHIGEIQSKGKMVVGPGSRHPSGNMYKVIRNSDIAYITETELKRALDVFIRKRTVKRSSKVDISQFDGLNVGSFIELSDFKKASNGDYQGPHPIHGSSGGQNFTVNPDKNVWYCFRHDTGGGPLHLIAMLEGIIDCSECENGIMKGEVLEKTVDIIKNKYKLKL